MEKTYNPKQIEQALYQNWEKSGYFKPSGQGEAYCIMIPPPNVTGSLHMGHGFQCTLMDALIRYQRMCGKNVLWQAGTDHAGIATQMVVENQLHLQNKTRHDLGREKFIEKVWEWKEESGGRITQQMRRLGASLDWSRECFTMDAPRAKAVQEVFIRLYDEGLIYRGKRLVNWDPHFKSAISNLEVNNTEEEGSLWYIRYPVIDSAEFIIIATTRPETLLGDAAVAVNPDDTRYQHLIGKKIQLPLCDRHIPIIADSYVDATFASGCVKITPAHDFNDYEVGQRHQLPLINIFTDTAHINDNAPKKYQGLERFAARKQIIADLEAAGLLEKTVKHTLSVPRNDRGGNIVEPYLTDQWYVKTQTLADVALQAVVESKTQFVPENWTKTYNQWLENIEDWCISRQLWWGHRIPAWYDKEGKIYVGDDEASIRKKYQLTADHILKQDEDVLDTWFSSALWPFSTLGWPEKTSELKTFYPSSVLVTGFDIIFFWVARMMMFGLHFMHDTPFKEVFITGLIRDHEGQKMSKSKGNVLDPIDLIDGISIEELVSKRTIGLMQESKKPAVEKATRKQFPNGIEGYGTDALRFTYCALSTPGRDIRFDVSRMEGYRNFCNKLWNAARFVLMQIDHPSAAAYAASSAARGEVKHFVNQYILSQLQNVIEQAHEYFKTYRFDLLANLLYEFSWHEYCDWYLELSKPILNQGSAEEKQETLNTLMYVLDQILRLLHPIIPFITETIWQEINNTQNDTLMLADYPVINNALINPNAEKEITWLKQVILAIRNLRGEMNIAPSKALSVLLNKGSEMDKRNLSKHQTLLCALAKLEKMQWLEGQAPACATALAGELEMLIPLADFLNKEEELKRLAKEIEKTEKEQQRVADKLNNAGFLDKAPADVVEKEKLKLTELVALLEKLRLQVKKL